MHLFIATSTVPHVAEQEWVEGEAAYHGASLEMKLQVQVWADSARRYLPPVARCNTAVSEEAAASGAVSPCLLCYSSKVLRTQETELKGGQTMCVVGDPKISPERINDHIRVSKYHDMNLYSSWVTTDSDC